MCKDMPEPAEEFVEFLDEFLERMRKGGKAEKKDILTMLAAAPDSPETGLLKKKAREKATEVTGNRGRVWSAVGIEHRTCPMNCQFCSFGEDWGLVKEDFDWPVEDIIEAARLSVEQGASWFTLRTNAGYDIERLCEIARRVRSEVPGDYALVVNTGDLSQEAGDKLLKNGINGIYHTWRLGEGSTTRLNPTTRISTMNSATKAGLELYHMVEPLGPEHTDEEIADRIMAANRCGASLGGVMARVNVPGTPLASSGQVAEDRISQIIAVCRLCAGSGVKDICVVPPLKSALEAGANVVTVEVGAIPRSAQTNQTSAWKGFGVREAMDFLESAGYDTACRSVN